MSLSTLIYTSPALTQEPNCKNPNTTIVINQCATIELESAQKQMQQYLNKALEHRNEDTELIAAIQHSQNEWNK